MAPTMGNLLSLACFFAAMASFNMIELPNECTHIQPDQIKTSRVWIDGFMIQKKKYYGRQMNSVLEVGQHLMGNDFNAWT